MNYVNIFPRVASICRISQTALLISQTLEKASPSMKNVKLSTSSSVFLELLSIGQKKTAFAAHSTYSKVCTFWVDPIIVQWICPILQNLGYQASNTPTPTYKYSQPNIYIIKLTISSAGLSIFMFLFIMSMINILY